MTKIDWTIELSVDDCICEICRKKIGGFLPHACNAVTNGMNKYNHKEFQFVLRVSDVQIMQVLNTMGILVQAGKTFKSGDLVSGICENMDARLEEFEDRGKKVLRVVAPDEKGLFPEDPRCDASYKLQLLKTDELYFKKELS